jgi:hypothetical protein
LVAESRVQDNAFQLGQPRIDTNIGTTTDYMNVTDSTFGLRHFLRHSTFNTRHLRKLRVESVPAYDALGAHGLNGRIFGTTFFEKTLDAILAFLGKSVPPYDVRGPVHATNCFRNSPKITSVPQ